MKGSKDLRLAGLPAEKSFYFFNNIYQGRAEREDD